MIRGLDHIAIFISSEASLDFYRAFGFEEKARFVRPRDTALMMECGGIMLEVFIDPNHPPRVTEPEAMGLRHVCFAVESVDAFVAAMAEKGIIAEPVRTDWYRRRFTFFKDPDGLPLEIKEI